MVGGPNGHHGIPPYPQDGSGTGAWRIPPYPLVISLCNGHVTVVTVVTVSEDGAVRAGRCRRPPGYECGGDAAHPAYASRPATASVCPRCDLESR